MKKYSNYLSIVFNLFRFNFFCVYHKNDPLSYHIHYFLQSKNKGKDNGHGSVVLISLTKWINYFIYL